MSYLTIDVDQIIEKTSTLELRITERVGPRGLAQVCSDLDDVARATAARVRSIGEPDLKLRAVVGAAMIGSVGVLGLLARGLRVHGETDLGFFDLAQGVEAITNVLILMSAAMVFLVRTERRQRRKVILGAMSELRSLAHVIDAHQITKDPDRVLGHSQATASSPAFDLTPQQLIRYLNYCSEMLSLIGKLAALYPQAYGDDIAIAAVNEVEQLTMGMSNEIWTKVQIVHAELRLGPHDVE